MPSDEKRVGGGIATNRRRVLQTAGMSATAATATVGQAGATALPTAATPSADHYVVASDMHLGSPFSNGKDSMLFLTEEVPSIDPDVLVLNGDIFEGWYRGMDSVFIEYNHVTKAIDHLYDTGIEVVLNAGNHDYRLTKVGDTRDDVAIHLPWEFRREYFFESGGTEFVATHGDSADPKHQNWRSDWMCARSDSFGESYLDVRDWFNDDEPGEYVGETGTVDVTASGSDWQEVELRREYEDAVVVTSPASLNSEAPVRPRVKNDSDGFLWWGGGVDSFEVRLDRWDGEDDHPSETVHYCVFERGHHTLAEAVRINAGRIEIEDEWKTVWYDASFNAPPVVIADLQTDSGGGWFSSGPDPMQPQIRNVTNSHFEVRLRKYDGSEPDEQELGWVAFEPGTVSVEGGGVDVSNSLSIGGGGTHVGFDHSFHHIPVFLAGVQSGETAEPTFLRHDGLSTNGAYLTLQGEATLSPPSESVGYVAIRGYDEVYATQTSLVEDDNRETELQQRWNETVQSANLSTSDAPDEMPRTDAQFVSTDVKSNLLSDYDEFVIASHTHVPELDGRYVNTGAWTERRNPDYLPQNVFVEIQQGDVTVWSWNHSGNDVLFD